MYYSDISGDFNASNAVAFARTRLDFHPDPVQTRVLDPNIRHGTLNCTRQWGKSTTLAVKNAAPSCASSTSRRGAIPITAFRSACPTAHASSDCPAATTPHAASRHLPLATPFFRELAQLRVTTTASGHQSVQTERSTQHDDMVFAVALAAFANCGYKAPNSRPPFAPTDPAAYFLC